MKEANLCTSQELVQMYYGGGSILGKAPLAAATIRLAAIALAALFIALMGATSASAQQPNACSNGIAVTDPSDNPGLVQDCQTLLTLKDALAGDAQLNWSADAAIDTWLGVAVGDSPARVTGINLANGGLTGVIPAQLGSLPGLTTLYLHRNQLTGAIPSELGSLSNLQGLYIQRNQLTGEIPAQLGDLSNLTRLYLINNGFTGCIPAALRDVQHSDVGSAGLLFCAENTPTPTPEPDQDSGCSNGIAVPNPEDNPGLVRDCDILLYVKDALRGDYPLNWSADTAISDWDGVRVHPTRRGVIHINFGRWDYGRYNEKYGYPYYERTLNGVIPPELGSLSNLWGLFLSNTQLTGPIPPELGNLSNLDQLLIDDNQLTGEIPSELGKLSNLRYLTVHDNQLTGCIPTVLLGKVVYHPDTLPLPLLSLPYCRSDKDALTALYYRTGGKSWTRSDNWLSDEPLGEWHGVTTDADGRVTALSLRDNNLVGNIPRALGFGGNLDKLEVLALDGNSLKGEIPSELGNLTGLTRLALNRNDLKGRIPDNLKNLKNLSILGLANNRLYDRVPAWLGSLSNLTKISMHDTRLRWYLPAELGNLSNLERLAIQNTDLIGALPRSFAGLTNLNQLYLDAADHCAPYGDYFQAWLAGVADTNLGDDGLKLC